MLSDTSLSGSAQFFDKICEITKNLFLWAIEKFNVTPSSIEKLGTALLWVSLGIAIIVFFTKNTYAESIEERDHTRYSVNSAGNLRKYVSYFKIIVSIAVAIASLFALPSSLCSTLLIVSAFVLAVTIICMANTVVTLNKMRCDSDISRIVVTSKFINVAMGILCFLQAFRLYYLML